jgi:ubiquinone/menaquinone biosynthesis C-methylase UbiE
LGVTGKVLATLGEHSTVGHISTYVIHCEHECERLEAQARLGGIADHLKYLHSLEGKQVLDAGCGSGSMARLIAKHYPRAQVTGVDARQSYLDFAAEKANGDRLRNVSFVPGDLLKLPFSEATFDVAWTKYVLQWLREPKMALAELRRVLKPGGLIVSCDFVGFATEHFPVEPKFDRELRVIFAELVDPNVGRKVAPYLIELGFENVTVDMETDRLFTTIGRIDPERRRNWEIQLKAARPAIVKLVGSEAAAEDILTRFFAYYDDPGTCSFTTLFFTRGTKPA